MNPKSVNIELAARLAEALAALDNVSELAEDGRMSVSAIGQSIRQVDVDASSAVTRGHFMTISEFAKTVTARIRTAVKPTKEQTL